MSRYDCIVVGLGVMGSAVLRALAQRGRRVLGVDRFAALHAFGSSHGESRIIREAYFEDPCYVPMVQRAYALWAELERESGIPLYRRTGGLMIGHPDCDLVAGSLRSAREHGLRHELLDTAQVRKRFPALHPQPDMAAVHEPRAGVLAAEACVHAQLTGARHAGADVRFGATVDALGLDKAQPSIRIASEDLHCRRLILCAGAWSSQLLPSLAGKLTVERQVLHWFEAEAEADADASRLDPESCPVHLWQRSGGGYPYGFPNLGRGVKFARHRGGTPCQIESIDRNVAPAEIEAVRDWASRHVPGAAGRHLRSSVCVYTNTSDGHFLIAPAPEHPDVLVVSACSGHGFKFAPTIGEIAKQWACDETWAFDLRRFAWR